VLILLSLSDLLYLPMPSLPTAAQKNESVLLLSASSGGQHDSEETSFPSGGKWEDEEERRFYEDLQDLRDFVPKSVLGLDSKDKPGEQQKEEDTKTDQDAKEKQRKEVEQAEIKMLEKEIEGLGLNGVERAQNGSIESIEVEDEEYVGIHILMVHGTDFLKQSSHPDSFPAWNTNASGDADACYAWTISASDRTPNKTPGCHQPDPY
jgi:hypothetical protein